MSKFLDIIIKSLTECVDDMPTISPTKMVYKSRYIDGGTLPELAKLFGEIAVEFGIDVNSIEVSMDDHESHSSNLVAAFEVPADKTEAEIAKEYKNLFNRRCWNYVYPNMIAAGYKRIGSSTSEHKKFDDTSLHEMFFNKDYDRLVAWYKLFFKEG